jgi:hypothetical protein
MRFHSPSVGFDIPEAWPAVSGACPNCESLLGMVEENYCSGSIGNQKGFEHFDNLGSLGGLEAS